MKYTRGKGTHETTSWIKIQTRINSCRRQNVTITWYPLWPVTGTSLIARIRSPLSSAWQFENFTTGAISIVTSRCRGNTRTRLRTLTQPSCDLLSSHSPASIAESWLCMFSRWLSSTRDFISRSSIKILFLVSFVESCSCDCWLLCNCYRSVGVSLQSDWRKSLITNWRVLTFFSRFKRVKKNRHFTQCACIVSLWRRPPSYCGHRAF